MLNILRYETPTLVRHRIPIQPVLDYFLYVGSSKRFVCFVHGGHGGIAGVRVHAMVQVHNFEEQCSSRLHRRVHFTFHCVAGHAISSECGLYTFEKANLHRTPRLHSRCVAHDPYAQHFKR